MGIMQDLNQATDKKVLAGPQAHDDDDFVEVDMQEMMDGAMLIATARETGGTYDITVSVDVDHDSASGGSFDTDLTTLTFDVVANGEALVSEQIQEYHKYIKVNDISVTGDGTPGNIAVLVIGGSKTS